MLFAQENKFFEQKIRSSDQLDYPVRTTYLVHTTLQDKLLVRTT